MSKKVTRRNFVASALAVPAVVALPHTSTEVAAQPSQPNQSKTSFKRRLQKGAAPFSFLVLGDLHFDRLAHHDMEWLEREKPNDIRQVQNYSRLTAEMLPRTFANVREAVAAAKQRSKEKVEFVAHIGDLVEGLCGTAQLAERQSMEATAFVRDAKLGAPFLFCKGNHDITGPGASEAYGKIFLPFINEQMHRTLLASTKPGEVDKAYFAFEHRDALFLFFDAYDHPRSLDWLESALAKRTARHLFVFTHPPVVPYGARSTWHVYAKPQEGESRTRLLNLLGAHRAIVLNGHIHKYNALIRDTERGGRFVQLAINSVIPQPEIKVTNMLAGINEYNPNQIKVEPTFSPTTETERRAVLQQETPHIRFFEYADAPGYARITVDGDGVRADVYTGLGTKPWRTLELSRFLSAKFAAASGK